MTKRRKTTGPAPGYGDRIRWLKERSSEYPTWRAIGEAVGVTESAVISWVTERTRPTRAHAEQLAELIGYQGRGIEWMWDGREAATERASLAGPDDTRRRGQEAATPENLGVVLALLYVGDAIRDQGVGSGELERALERVATELGGMGTALGRIPMDGFPRQR